MSSTVDEIQFQIIWSRLGAIVEEQARILMKTAFSPVVRDSGDLSAALFDRRGRMLAQAVTGTPGHVNSTAAAVPLMLECIPAEKLEEGDHLITNDPWLTSGHLHDVTIVSPVFRRGELVGFFACTCHQLDIGGRGQGPDAASVFEEGLAIPVMKLVTRGQVNRDLLDLIRVNVRTPYEVEADILSYVSANETSAEILLSSMEETRLTSLESIGDLIIARSEAAMAEEIAKLPRGRANNRIRLDGYGEPIEIHCALEVKDREIVLDFSGSSPASTRGINLVLNYTKAYAKYGVRCLVGPDIPNNSGSLAPISVQAPLGSVLNAQRPWPVCARHIIGQFLPDAVMGCLAQIVPERVPAEGASCLWGIQARGGPEIDAVFSSTRAQRSSDRYEVLFFNSGGAGARPDKDGLSATAFPSGVRAMPVEVVEKMAPLIVWRKELRPDSAGHGKWRGGFGQIVELATVDGSPFALSAMFDRTTVPAQGRAGGGDGAVGELRLKNGPTLEAKGMQMIPPGTRVEFLLPGGGGFGDPAERAEESVEADILEGLVSRTRDP
jgi:N-methylhydantoinase B/oxoprolinase/acetone carboxylase alpha subunit